jgi:hypothetical protein
VLGGDCREDLKDVGSLFDDGIGGLCRVEFGKLVELDFQCRPK